MMFSEGEKEKLESYLHVHLRKKTNLPDAEKLQELKKKLRNKILQLLLNVAIILVFIFAYLNNLTQFGVVFYYVLFGVFVLNIVLITIQYRQIRELIEYVQHRIHNE